MDDIATHWHGHGCTQPPPPPLLTQQHGMVAWLEHMRAEVRCTRFSIVAPPPLLFLPLPSSPFAFLLGFWVRTQHHSSFLSLLPPRFFPLSGVSPILVQRVPLRDCDPHRSHGVLLSPSLFLSSFPLPTHQQTALGCEASRTWRAGMLAAAPEEDLVTKEQITPSSCL